MMFVIFFPAQLLDFVNRPESEGAKGQNPDQEY
jgi:hypothetical protein